MHLVETGRGCAGVIAPRSASSRSRTGCRRGPYGSSPSRASPQLLPILAAEPAEVYDMDGDTYRAFVSYQRDEIRARERRPPEAVTRHGVGPVDHRQVPRRHCVTAGERGRQGGVWRQRRSSGLRQEGHARGRWRVRGRQGDRVRQGVRRGLPPTLKPRAPRRRPSGTPPAPPARRSPAARTSSQKRASRRRSSAAIYGRRWAPWPEGSATRRKPKRRSPSRPT